MADFSGIDPNALLKTIGSFKGDKDRLRHGASSIKSQFARFGIDTQPLTSLVALCGWLDDQLPMLQRRQALATVLEKQHPGLGNTVQIPEPYSMGAADAALFQQAVANKDQASIKLVKNDLRKHLNDTEFLKAYSDACPPNDVTAFQGLPAEVADKLNRIRLEAEVQRPDCPQRLKDLWQHLANPKDTLHRSDIFLLGFDNVDSGHIAVSYGNPDKSANTAVYVPGTGSSLDGASSDMNRALTLYINTNMQKSGSTASIYWLGYDAPQWDIPGPAGQANADNGAPKLAAFVNSLKVNHIGAGHVTLIGHSYGSTIVGDAFAHAGMNADDVIFVGSPGVTVDKASDLHLDPSHVWAGKAKFDPVPEISASLIPHEWSDDHHIRFGNDPTSSTFGGRTFDTGDGSGVAHAHSEYWDAGPSLDNMTKIVLGQSNEVTAMPTEQKIGTLPNLSDGVATAPDLSGAVLQNAGHAMGDAGAPIEHAGDSLHAFATAENSVLGAGGDLLSGDVDGSLHDLGDVSDDLKTSGKDAVRTSKDLFDW
ncbi:alpha/beta hydrolase [Streptomyces sp. NPDC006739]|uniref:alpha/beta hydrolase n=1 Tax=Streptomyces sp. NPDC006739 TaxID=3364763 RepID=UPI0036B7E5A4